jgi:hypothetical protein
MPPAADVNVASDPSVRATRMNRASNTRDLTSAQPLDRHHDTGDGADRPRRWSDDEIDEYVRQLVDVAPPLTELQRAKLGSLIRQVAYNLSNVA